MRDQGWELSSLVQSRSQETGNLLDDCFTGQEGTVLLGCKTQAVFSIPYCGSLLYDHMLHGSSTAEQMSTAHQHMTATSLMLSKQRQKQGQRYTPSFLTSFLFLFSFFKSSTLKASMPRALASSQCLWSPNTHTCSNIATRGCNPYLNCKVFHKW